MKNFFSMTERFLIAATLGYGIDDDLMSTSKDER